MNCVIPGINLKVIGRAIQALSRIGDELYFEAKEEHLSLRAVNMNKTVFATYNFFSIFFSTYEIAEIETNSEDLDSLTCKIQMKAILGVFKSPGHKEKKIDYCKVELDHNATKIIFKMKYKHDVTVIHSLRLDDMESLHVAYSTDSMSNEICASGQFYSKVLSNFQLSDDDISLEVGKSKTVVRNYTLGEVPMLKTIRSQLALMSIEFSTYKIGQDTNITFSLRPFRTAIHFAEFFNLNVTLNFETAGRPAVLVMKNPTFEVNFVMATINSDGSTQTTTTTATPLLPKRKISKPRPNPADITVQDQQVLESVNWENDFDTPEVNTDSSRNRLNSVVNKIITSTVPSEKSDRNGKNNNVNTGNNVDRQSDLDAEEMVVLNSPESPKSKRIKTIFGRCYEPTFHESMMNLGNVLAPDSDEEESEMEVEDVLQ